MSRASNRPHRIVSLAPSATSILIGLGARRHLVGVSKWCRHVADVRGLPELGDCWSLDSQAVTALAVANKRVYAIPDELLNTPALPLLQGASELFRAIHPELAGRR